MSVLLQIAREGVNRCVEDQTFIINGSLVQLNTKIGLVVLEHSAVR